jgi:hypothetical protein
MAGARDVFVNCAFDKTFQPIFQAIVFGVVRSGYTPRCALETDDASENRFSKIQRIVEECRYGIHDISRTESDGDPPLPRFNMPLELGLFLGAKRYGDEAQRVKRVLILDVERYRYQRFISDLAGQDLHAHRGQPLAAIIEVANWLRDQAGGSSVPGGKKIATEFAAFSETLPATFEARNLHANDVTFRDFVSFTLTYIDQIA